MAFDSGHLNLCKKDLVKFAQTLGIKNIPEHVSTVEDISHIVENPTLVKALLQQLQKTAKAGGLKGTEIINKIYIVGEEWTSQNGYLTGKVFLLLQSGHVF